MRLGSDKEALDYTLKYNPIMDHAIAERNLKEAKQMLEQIGVVFLLFSGACLGAIRGKAFIPWDDDIDIMSVVGPNGMPEAKVEEAVSAFEKNGYYVQEFPGSYNRSFSMIRDWIRIGWDCDPIMDGNIYVFPGIAMPAELFTNPKAIEFLGEKFLVPNPPEEYLRLKYGEEWMVPKKAGEYEKDVVEKIPDRGLQGRPASIRVLDGAGQPVPGAEVVLAGYGRTTTDDRGYTEILLPRRDWYALVVRYPGHEQVLYMEDIGPGKSYVYRADSVSKMSDNASGNVGTLGNILLPE
jgi:hypothetical protein